MTLCPTGLRLRLAWYAHAVPLGQQAPADLDPKQAKASASVAYLLALAAYRGHRTNCPVCHIEVAAPPRDPEFRDRLRERARRATV